MNTAFSVKIPQNIRYGTGAVRWLEQEVKGRYKKAVVFTDAGVYKAGLTEEPVRWLKEGGCSVEVISNLPPEPTCRQAQAVVERFLESGAELVVAVGGGSVMDVAKLASVAVRGEKVSDYVERPLLGRKRVKSIMIPTTAGTGAEATPNSIVALPEQELKVGIVNPELVADMVILDGNMIRELPEGIAAATGIDALCHAIECYTSNKANAFSNLFSMEALKLIFGNLVEACRNRENLEAKNKMLLAAFYGGVAIASSGTTAVHALSYPLGGKYHIAHGISNAMLLVPVMRFNRDACRREFAEIYDAVGGSGTGDEEEKGEWLISELSGMVKELKIPDRLEAFGVGKEDLEQLVEAGMKVTRLLQNNKKTVTAEDARKLYAELL